MISLFKGPVAKKIIEQVIMEDGNIPRIFENYLRMAKGYSSESVFSGTELESMISPTIERIERELPKFDFEMDPNEKALKKFIGFFRKNSDKLNKDLQIKSKTSVPDVEPPTVFSSMEVLYRGNPLFIEDVSYKNGIMNIAEVAQGGGFMDVSSNISLNLADAGIQERLMSAVDKATGFNCIKSDVDSILNEAQFMGEINGLIRGNG